MAALSSATSSTGTLRIAVPAEYFVYAEEAEKDINSLYRCLKCSTGIAGKKISAHDTQFPGWLCDSKHWATVECISGKAVFVGW